MKFAANRLTAESAGPPAELRVPLEAPLQAGQPSVALNEDPSRFCPVCSQRLESRRCKLICPVCGYYMSCADYY